MLCTSAKKKKWLCIFWVKQTLNILTPVPAIFIIYNSTNNRTILIFLLHIITYTECPGGECATLRGNVPYVKVHRSNPKHLYPKLNGYGDNGERKVWSSCGSTYCTCVAYCYRTLRMSVLQSHSRVKHIPPSLSTDVTVTVNCNSVLLDIHVPRKVLGTLRTITALVRVYVV